MIVSNVQEKLRVFDSVLNIKKNIAHWETHSPYLVQTYYVSKSRMSFILNSETWGIKNFKLISE